MGGGRSGQRQARVAATSRAVGPSRRSRSARPRRPWPRCRCTVGGGISTSQSGRLGPVGHQLAQPGVRHHAATQDHESARPSASAAAIVFATCTSTTASWNDAARSANGVGAALARSAFTRRTTAVFSPESEKS